jgi:uncharacterized protein YkwD
MQRHLPSLPKRLVFISILSFCFSAAGQAQTLDSEELTFLTLLNTYRAQNGAGPLQVSIALENSSTWMSNDMASKNYFSHTDSLGRDPFTRMAAFGYSYATAEGENIAAGNSDAQNTLTQWQTACDPDSSGACTFAHRQNMLNPSYVVIGIGRAFGANSTYGWYWTTDFGGFLDATLNTGTSPIPAPTINSFTANPSSITAGQSTTLMWNVSGSNVTLSIDNGVGNVSNVTSAVVQPAQTTTYTLTATNSGGSTTARATVTVGVSGPLDLALNQLATQSSTYASGVTIAAKAVDGNTDGKYADGSLSHTNLDANAWWQVDLGASATVDSIVVWNRTDCCGARLSDYWVFVSNTPFSPTDTPTTLQSRAGTWSSHQTVQPNPSTTITVPGAPGRYVRVQLSSTNYLSLAEVQVFGVPGQAPQDLALSKTAAQSSTYIPGITDASKGVDGITDGAFADGSLTHTNFDANAWWQVDLGASATVNSIVVWNRTDCCGNRLSDYWVFVSNTPFSPTDTPTTLQNRAGTWSSHQTLEPSPSATITVPQALGRYIRVQLSDSNYLSLAEVQVFGVLGQAPQDLALSKAATQSSTYAPGLTDATKGVDGNTDGVYADGSLTHTNYDGNAWWQLDLGTSATVSSIVVWNRTDCCGSRLSDYWVFVSNTPFASTDTPTTLENRAGTWSSHQTIQPNPSATITVPQAQGRYVRVQLSGANYLSLAEVQVFGQ